MLTSLNSHEEEEDPDRHHHHHRNPARGLPSPANHVRQLLISCAELISQSDFAAARRIVSLLSASSSPYGDSTDRVVHQFTKALNIRINRHTFQNLISSSSSPTPSISTNPDTLQSAYLTLNQITPFIRFSHLTANQAILEAIEGHRHIHILDFNTMQGVQWPPLMQAIAEGSDPLNPPSIRITGTGHDLETLQRTGHRLQTFAQSLGLNFQFYPLHIDDGPSSTTVLHLLSSINVVPEEMLAVNCVLYLHKLLKDDERDVRLFLRTIKAMNPKVVTVAEREARHNHPIFLQRFMEALDYYTAGFDSLEATLPPNSQERLTVEQVWFGNEIANIVAAEGEERRERHERFESWVEMMRSSGFANVPLSPFALSQAKLLLRLHYPSEGYQLQLVNDSFFLGWQNKALFSVSSWY
ncbi:scarecrow-like protein 18 isoform X2 [Magnolia sinica]|uniref:scarecrow-like protein 18 isoform X2 n=1 Tax=Magnolia sinica TaxID=86752 RepID=UPI002658182D|nr:scarecrow-like protein 18 isoform X2 [Magnolia sinica]